ncbi:MAG: inorganic diphosphatase [Polyangia bacterium]
MHSINLVHDLPPFDEQHNLRVVVETPRGANIKIKFDEDLGCFCLSRILPLGVTYPYDFGFVPQTLAQDGDPLDVLALVDAVTYPGVVIACRLLGALQVEERGLRGRPNHRLVAVPVKAARKDDLRNFIDLGRRAQQELERFFVMSSAFTSKDPVVRGWVGPEAAADMVHRAIARYREKHGLPPLPPRPHRQPRYGGAPGSGPANGAQPASASTTSAPSATSSGAPASTPSASSPGLGTPNSEPGGSES